MTVISQQELALPLDPVDEKEVTTVRFYGPYSWWPDGKYPYVKHAPEADQSGIYLWTVGLDEGDLVFYVGETATSFYKRCVDTGAVTPTESISSIPRRNSPVATS
jgi:hypothetical protein